MQFCTEKGRKRFVSSNVLMSVRHVNRRLEIPRLCQTKNGAQLRVLLKVSIRPHTHTHFCEIGFSGI